MRDLDFYRIVNVFAAEKASRKHFENRAEFIFQVLWKSFFSFCSIASINDKNIVEFFFI